MALSIPTVGVLTRTLSPSPTPSTVLALRSHHATSVGTHDLLVFVYEHEFEICLVESGGFIRRGEREMVYAKILAADTIGAKDSLDQIDDPLCGDALVLTLDTGNLVVYTFITHGTSTRAELHCHKPILRHSDPVDKIGPLLAIDRLTGIVAVAGLDGGIMLWSATQQPIEHDRGVEMELPSPIRWVLEGLGSTLRPDGHIIHMAFMKACDVVGRGELLLLQVMKAKIYARQLHIDCSGPTIEIQEQRRIRTGSTLPDLLIPIEIPGCFVLASDSGLILFTISSSAGEIMEQALHPNLDSLHAEQYETRNGVWTAWTKDDKNLRHDTVVVYYVCRSDGLVAMLSLDLKASAESGRCKMRLSAVSCVPHRLDRGVCAFNEPAHCDPSLVLPGSTGDGGLYAVQILSDIEDSDDSDMRTLLLERYQNLSDWSPNIDIISSTLPRSHDSNPRVGESLFATAGSGDTSRLVELRPGLEAHMLFSLDFKPVNNARRLWSAHMKETGASLLLTSDTTATNDVHSAALLHDGQTLISIDNETPVDVENLQSAGLASLDVAHPTVHISTWRVMGKILHITSRKVTILGLDVSTKIFECPSDENIKKAEVSYHDSIALLTLVTGPIMTTDLSHDIYFLRLSESLATQTEARIHNNSAEPSVFKHVRLDNIEFLALLNDDGQVSVVDRGGSMQATANCLPPTAICEEAVVVYTAQDNQTLLICAMRDGTVSIVSIATHHDGPVIERREVLTLGLTPVTVVPYQSSAIEDNRSAIAICGSRTYLLSPEEDHPDRKFSAKPIWVTDKDELDFQVNSITAVTQIEHDLYLEDMNVKGCLAILAGPALLIASVDEASGMAVPRSIRTKTSPTRVLYSRRLGHFALGGTQHHADTGEAEASIEFTRSNRKTIIKTEDGTHGDSATLTIPGEKLYCMTEWIHENKDGKRFAFLLVGTGLSSSSATSTSLGRVHLLQPKLSQGTISSLSLATTTKFDQPVRAIALYGLNGYIASHGPTISYYTYSSLNKKWVLVAGYRLHSPAQHISTTPPFIHLTTSSDSFMTLQLLGPGAEADDSNLSPSAFKLRLFATDQSASIGQHHLTFPSPFFNDEHTLAIMSTKTAGLKGLMIPTSTTSRAEDERRNHTALPLFSASLPQSIVRLVKHNISLDPTQQQNSIIGLTTMGALIGIKLLAPDEWALLRYVQLLCERSAKVCPSAARHFVVGGFKGDEVGEGSGVVLGFRGVERYNGEGEWGYESRVGLGWGAVGGMRAGEQMELDEDSGRRETVGERKEGWEVMGQLGRSERWRGGDMHVDGDIIGRLMRRGWKEARELLVEILEEERKRDDRVGEFVREHFSEEMGLVDGALEQITKSLESWGFW
ncbi:Hypothetical protein D9617_11g007650 [Elsinoe fawcettii]|nr:Hypothetical protein D9617_11g007650 [Elsinoe fawcettii]